MDLRFVAGGEAHCLNEVDFDLTPDGSTLVAGRHRRGTDPAVDLVAVDVATGEARVLAASNAVHGSVVCAPDGGSVECKRGAGGEAGGGAAARRGVVALRRGEGTGRHSRP